MNRFEHKGLQLGQALVSPCKKILVPIIPKNSSTWLKVWLRDENKWTLETGAHEKYTGTDVLVALRDPVERWLSGAAEYLSLYFDSTEVQNTGVAQILEDVVAVDDHTECQCVFYECFNNEKNTLYYLPASDPMTIISFVEFLGVDLNKKSFIRKPINTTMDPVNKLKLDYKNWLRHCVNLNKITEYYRIYDKTTYEQGCY